MMGCPNGSSYTSCAENYGHFGGVVLRNHRCTSLFVAVDTSVCFTGARVGAGYIFF